MPSAASPSAARSVLPKRAAVGDERHVAAAPPHCRQPDLHRGIVAVLAFHRVERGVLEDEHRIGLLECGEQQALGVGDRRGRHDLDAGDVRVPHLERVRVLRRELAPAAGCHPHDERHAELAAGHVPQRRGVVEDLVEGEQAEVDGHHLDDRAHAAQRGPDAGPDEGRLGERRVADALRTELVEQAQAHGERPAVAPDVLTHQKDALVRAHRLAQRRADRFPIGRLGHDACYASALTKAASAGS